MPKPATNGGPKHDGLVPDEAVIGANIVGGDASACEKVPMGARDVAIGEITSEAARWGSNGVVGVDLDYEVLGGAMLMVSVNRTGVMVRWRGDTKSPYFD